MEQVAPFRTLTRYCREDPEHRGAILITYETDDDGHTSVRADIHGRKSLNARAVYQALKGSKILYGILKYAIQQHEQDKQQQK